MILNKDQMHNFDFDLFLNRNGRSLKPLSLRADIGLDKIITGTIPNQTTMMFVLLKTGEVLKQYTYGLTQNLKNMPPDVSVPQGTN